MYSIYRYLPRSRLGSTAAFSVAGVVLTIGVVFPVVILLMGLTLGWNELKSIGISDMVTPLKIIFLMEAMMGSHYYFAFPATLHSLHGGRMLPGRQLVVQVLLPSFIACVALAAVLFLLMPLE